MISVITVPMFPMLPREILMVMGRGIGNEGFKRRGRSSLSAPLEPATNHPSDVMMILMLILYLTLLTTALTTRTSTSLMLIKTVKGMLVMTAHPGLVLIW